MTLQEIKELVSKKIAGQGSQVDIGGALAEILNGIVDAISDTGTLLIKTLYGEFGQGVPIADFASAMEITVEQARDFFYGRYPFLETKDGYKFTRVFSYQTETHQVAYGATNETLGGYYISAYLERDGETIVYQFVEL